MITFFFIICASTAHQTTSRVFSFFGIHVAPFVAELAPRPVLRHLLPGLAVQTAVLTSEPFFCTQSGPRNAPSVVYSSSVAAETRMLEDAAAVSHVHVPLAAAAAAAAAVGFLAHAHGRSILLGRCRRRRAGGGQDLAARVDPFGADPQASGDPVAVRAEAGPAEGPREV